MKRQEVKKGQVLQRSGELNSKAFYVKSGLLRAYSIDKKGREHIFMFAPEDWLVADSVSPDEPTMLFIDALEDSIVLVSQKPSDTEVNEREIDVKKLINRMKVLQKRTIQLMSSTALERYEYFIETYPDLTQRVSQRMIASYLGVTPEALSKVKSEKFQKKKT